MEKKMCSTCKKEKELDKFTKNKNKMLGVHNQCKDCRKLEYQKNKKHKLEYGKKYHKENKEEINKKQKKYYEKNREKICKKVNEYRLEHLKEIKEKKKIYYYEGGGKEQMAKRIKERRANGEFYEIDRNYRHKRKAIEENSDITDKWLFELRKSTNGICPVCDVEMTLKNRKPNQYNLDHIIPFCKGGKHMMNNVRYICSSCNLKKGTKLLSEM